VPQAYEVVYRIHGRLFFIYMDGGNTGIPEGGAYHGEAGLGKVIVKNGVFYFMDQDYPVKFFRLEPVKAGRFAGILKFNKEKKRMIPKGLKVPFNDGKEFPLEHIEGIGDHNSHGKGPLKHHTAGGLIGDIAGVFD
jgi:hypothetical protein